MTVNKILSRLVIKHVPDTKVWEKRRPPHNILKFSHFQVLKHNYVTEGHGYFERELSVGQLINDETFFQWRDNVKRTIQPIYSIDKFYVRGDGSRKNFREKGFMWQKPFMAIQIVSDNTHKYVRYYERIGKNEYRKILGLKKKHPK